MSGKNIIRRVRCLPIAAVIVMLLVSITAVMWRNTATATASTGFLYREGKNLILDGRVFRYVGFNAYGMSGCEGSAWSPGQLDAYFSQLPANAMTRTWAFPSGGTAGLDRIVASAEAHNQKVIFSLADANSWCNDTDGAIDNTGDGIPDQGTGKQLSWYQGGYRTRYIPWVQQTVSRYANSPAVGMWEIMNEVGARVQNGTIDNATVKNFLDTTAATIKAIDPNHLVESGAQAGYVAGTTDYAYIHSGPNIDVGSVHEYDYDYQDSNTIISSHFTKALNAMNSINKPIIVGETGIHAMPSGCRTNLATRAAAFKQKFDGYLAAGAAGINLWNRSQNQPTGVCTSDLTYNIGPNDPTIAVVEQYVMPTVQLTAPGADTTLNGTRVLSATANDVQGIASVQFMLDGRPLGAADTTGPSPYTVSWDTRTASNGSHTLSAVATNMRGLSSVSVPVPIIVDNVAPTNPSNLKATVIARDSAILSWDASADNMGVQGYRIYHNGVLIADQPGTTFTATGLSVKEHHILAVEAYDAAGNISGRASVAVTTKYFLPYNEEAIPRRSPYPITRLV